MSTMDDLYQINENTLKPRATGKRTSSILLAGFALLFVTFTVWLVGFSGVVSLGAHPAEKSTLGEISTEQVEERAVTTFVADFLMNYLNYSYTIYPDAVRRAEAMMTSEMQGAYNTSARDRDFIKTLEATKASTSGFRIIPGSVKMGHEGQTFYVQLSGAMIYTTLVNGASADWPMNLLLQVEKTDKGFLVSNVQRTR